MPVTLEWSLFMNFITHQACAAPRATPSRVLPGCTVRKTLLLHRSDTSLLGALEKQRILAVPGELPPTVVLNLLSPPIHSHAQCYRDYIYGCEDPLVKEQLF